MRGENVLPTTTIRSICGTPPHAWGKPQCLTSQGQNSSVHPHMRGENYVNLLAAVLIYGTPPHAWGKRSHAIFTR